MLGNTLTNSLQKVFAKGNLVAGVIGVLLLSNYALATEIISGAGATFPYPVYAKWAESYTQKTGIKMNYQSIWSCHHGGKLVEELDYVPMPKHVVSLVENTWKQDIKGSSGQAVWK